MGQTKIFCWETPPRMWRKLLRKTKMPAILRNTSTYVEKTEKGDEVFEVIQKHLHVCGENYIAQYP